MITCANPHAQFSAHSKEITEAVLAVMNGGHYVLGPQVAEFEKSFAQYCGSEYAVGLNSGTDALILSLKALDVGPGDEVITVSHTALATISAIVATGATPVVIDIHPEYYTINEQIIIEAITPKTKAIIPVHIYGQVVEIDSILKTASEHFLPVIEDCAQSTGATYKGKKVGALGTLGCFSFYPTKNLGAIGDGGMVVTNDKKLFERIQRLRQYGWDQNRETYEPGLNSRLDEIQASILNVKLKKLDADNKRRREIADLYSNNLQNLPITLPRVRLNTEHAFHLYVIQAENRDALKEHLSQENIHTGIHYLTPGHQHLGYKQRCKFEDSKMAVTDSLCKNILSLPMYPELTNDHIVQIIHSIKKFYKAL
jgi:dTDP-4-amino-4,6-dideoxygalactose transaminase